MSVSARCLPHIVTSMLVAVGLHSELIPHHYNYYYVK